MNDREVLQALLDGKIVRIKQGTWHSFYYKLVEDKVWTRWDDDEWEPAECIPELDSNYVEIEEDEE